MRARVSGLNDATVGEDDGERQHGLAHRSIAHGGGAGSARRRHAADRAVGAGVDEERQPVLSEVRVELTMGDAGFDGHIEIFRAEAHDPVHARHVDRYPSMERPDVTLERGTGAKRDDRRAVPGADPHDARHVVGRLREDHDVGSVRSVVRLAVAVMIPHGGRHGHAIGQQRAEIGDERVAAKRHGSRIWLPKSKGVHAIIAEEHAQDVVENGEVRSLLGLSPYGRS